VFRCAVVEVQPSANACFGFGHSLRQRPQPLDKNIVHAPALAVHADYDAMPLQGAGKVVPGELAALIGIKDRDAQLQGLWKEAMHRAISVYKPLIIDEIGYLPLAREQANLFSR
jgi:hypothetical protein